MRKLQISAVGLGVAAIVLQGACAPSAIDEPSVETRRSRLFFGRATNVAAGTSHTCARLGTPGAVCWGAGTAGQLGHGSFANSTIPVPVSDLARVQKISAGERYSCAIRATGPLSIGSGLQAGQVACWGSNVNGTLGDGNEDVSSAVPVDAQDLPDAIDVAAGNLHTCAVRETGDVLCWGYDGAGQLGNGGAGHSAIPVSVSGLSDAVDVAVGFEHSCAVSALEGVVFCWGWGGADTGNGPYSPLGRRTTESSDVPVAVWINDVFVLRGAVAVVAGQYHSCALLGNGSVACWGIGSFGQLGNGSTSNTTQAVLVSNLDDAVEITSGPFHTCALRESRQIVCWGYGADGQLGNGTNTTITPEHVTVSGASDFIDVSAGQLHTCGVRESGEVLCWGNGGNGRLGDGGNQSSAFPVRVVGLSENSGEPCTANDECFSRFCVDGVCCNTACGGGDPTDCQACSGVSGKDGSCGFLPPSHTCRGATDLCDLAATCTGDSPTCPANGFKANDQPCRGAVTTCDATEFCSGGSSICPGDAPASSGTLCAAPADPCQIPPECSGTSFTCPAPMSLPNCSYDVATPAAGTDVDVDIGGGADAPNNPGGVTLEVPEATGTEEVTVVESSSGPPVPDGFRIIGGGFERYWDVTTDPPDAFAPPITICIQYDPTWVMGNENLIQIQHWNGSDWEMLDPMFLMSEDNKVCGITETLSPFILVEPLPESIPRLSLPRLVVAEATGPAGAAVAFAATAQDREDGSLIPTCVPASGSTFSMGLTRVTCTVNDSDHVPASDSFFVWVQDTTDPVWSQVPQTVAAFATSTGGARINYTKPTATDAVSGPRTVVCDPPPGSLFPLGKTVVTCRAFDSWINGTTAKFTVHVTYQAPTDGTFFLSPIRPDGSAVFSIGERIPVRFQLTGASRNITDLRARLFVGGDHTAEGFFEYDAKDKRYELEWKTNGKNPGTYRLRADLGDGVVHQIDVQLVGRVR